MRFSNDGSVYTPKSQNFIDRPKKASKKSTEKVRPPKDFAKVEARFSELSTRRHRCPQTDYTVSPQACNYKILMMFRI